MVIFDLWISNKISYLVILGHGEAPVGREVSGLLN